MSISKWLKNNTHSLSGKVVAVSGATGGIGRRLCEHLAALGATLILLDRSTERSNALISELTALHPDLVASHIRLDLSDIECVARVTDRLCTDPPDFIIFNAGIYHVPRVTCGCGYNNIFQVNFLSPYYMARKLNPHIRARGGKMIAVGSIAHNYSHIDPSDIDFSLRHADSKVYGNAKRFLMFALDGLFGGDSTLSVAHPGITLTNITAHYPRLIFAIIKHPMKLIFMSPKKASLCILNGIFEDCGKGEWIGPRLFGIWGYPRRKALRTCSESEAEQICSIAEQAYIKMCEHTK